MLKNLTTFGAPIAVAGALIALSNELRFGSILKTGYHLIFPTPAVLLSTPWMTGAYGLLFDREVGLLFYVPWILVVPFLWRRFQAKYRNEAILVFSMTLVNFAFFSKYNAWHGGWAIGPRMLYAIIPFLSFPLAVWFDRPTRLQSIAGRLTLFLIVLSLLIQSLIIVYPWSRYYTMDAYNRQHGIHAWWSGEPLAEIVNALPELLFIQDPAPSPAHDYLLTFPNASNQTRADFWLLKASLMGLPRAIPLVIGILLLGLFAWSLRALFTLLALQRAADGRSLQTVVRA